MKLALIGVGLIGGSFAAALRAGGEVEEVIGFDTDANAVAQGRERGIVSRAAASAAEAAALADLVVIATPVGAFRATLASIAPALSGHALVTDVGSTKRSVVDDAAATLDRAVARFVPAHPIAGGERPGVAGADPGLFRGRLAITTPTDVTDPAALATIERLWMVAGARLERLDPDLHDRIFAAVSHLPHLLAFALVEMIAAGDAADQKFAHAGAGFRDFTRIAASSPQMWRDICLANRAPILTELNAYRSRLDALERAIAAGDGKALQAVFSAASAARRTAEGSGTTADT